MCVAVFVCVCVCACRFTLSPPFSLPSLSLPSLRPYQSTPLLPVPESGSPSPPAGPPGVPRAVPAGRGAYGAEQGARRLWRVLPVCGPAQHLDWRPQGVPAHPWHREGGGCAALLVVLCLCACMCLTECVSLFLPVRVCVCVCACVCLCVCFVDLCVQGALPTPFPCSSHAPPRSQPRLLLSSGSGLLCVCSCVPCAMLPR